jgi:hypothetical protein
MFRDRCPPILPLPFRAPTMGMLCDVRDDDGLWHEARVTQCDQSCILYHIRVEALDGMQ